MKVMGKRQVLVKVQLKADSGPAHNFEFGS